MSRGEQFEHAAGAGAEIEQRPDRLVGKRRADRFFDGGVGDVQPADTVPFGGVPAEIVLCGCRARGSHRGKPFAVACDDGIVRIEPGDQGACDIGGAAGLAQAKKGPRSFAVALDQTRFGQQAQMARQAGLRLPQNGSQIGDRQLGFADQHQEP